MQICLKCPRFTSPVFFVILALVSINFVNAVRKSKHPLSSTAASATLNNATGDDVCANRPLYKFYKSGVCRDFIHSAARSSYNITLDYGNKRHPFNVTSDSDITLTSMFSYDRVFLLDVILRHWSGPLAWVLYGTPQQAQEILDLPAMRARRVHRLDSGGTATKRTGNNVRLHLVQPPTDGDDGARAKQKFYFPYNMLRNIGQESVARGFVAAVDIDTIPPPKSYVKLRKYVRTMTANLRSKNIKRPVAYVIPALNGLDGVETTKMFKIFPQNKTEALTLLSARELVPRGFRPFRADYGGGNTATNYERWKSTEQTYEIKELDDTFEGQLLFSVNDRRLKYAEEFVGHGGNKYSLPQTARALGYRFLVLPRFFTVHIPHKPSAPKLERKTYTQRQTKCKRAIARTYRCRMEHKFFV